MTETIEPPSGAFGGWRWYELPDAGHVRLSAMLYELVVPRNPDARADGYLRACGFTHLVDENAAPNTVAGFFYERGRWWRYPLTREASDGLG